MIVLITPSGITFQKLKNLEVLNHWSENKVREYVNEMVREGSVIVEDGVIQTVPFKKEEPDHAQDDQ